MHDSFLCTCTRPLQQESCWTQGSHSQGALGRFNQGHPGVHSWPLHREATALKPPDAGLPKVLVLQFQQTSNVELGHTWACIAGRCTGSCRARGPLRGAARYHHCPRWHRSPAARRGGAA